MRFISSVEQDISRVSEIFTLIIVDGLLTYYRTKGDTVTDTKYELQEFNTGIPTV